MALRMLFREAGIEDCIRYRQGSYFHFYTSMQLVGSCWCPALFILFEVIQWDQESRSTVFGIQLSLWNASWLIQFFAKRSKHITVQKDQRYSKPWPRKPKDIFSKEGNKERKRLRDQAGQPNSIMWMFYCFKLLILFLILLAPLINALGRSHSVWPDFRAHLSAHWIRQRRCWQTATAVNFLLWYLAPNWRSQKTLSTTMQTGMWRFVDFFSIWIKSNILVCVVS